MNTMALLGMIALIGLPSQSSAQVTYGGCTDARGIPVLSIPDGTLSDIAEATVDVDGNPTIRYNPQIVASARRQTRLFFYTHECAHHALGHVLSGLQLGQEQEADCWGIRTLVDL